MTTVYVRPYGKRFKVTFCFAQTQIVKIMTASKVNDLANDSAYKIVYPQ